MKSMKLLGVTLVLIYVCCVPAPSALALSLTHLGNETSGPDPTGITYDFVTGDFYKLIYKVDPDVVEQSPTSPGTAETPPSIAFPGAELTSSDAGRQADLNFALTSFTLGGTPVPQNALIGMNGNGDDTIYAFNKDTGAVIASLALSNLFSNPFQPNNSYSAAFNPTTGTMFILGQHHDGGSASAGMAEINPDTGAVINIDLDLGIGANDFGKGGISIMPNGNILLLRGATTLYEYTPAMALVDTESVTETSFGGDSLAYDWVSGELWISTPESGVIAHYSGLPTGSYPAAAIPEPGTLGLTVVGFLSLLLLGSRTRRRDAARSRERGPRVEG